MNASELVGKLAPETFEDLIKSADYQNKRREIQKEINSRVITPVSFKKTKEEKIDINFIVNNL